MSSTHEAWVTDKVLLTFDGDVLEAFAEHLRAAHRPL